MTAQLHNIVDLICLLYHEARNVRHPIKAGKLTDAQKYARLVNLPNNRIEAWQVMETLRARAVDSGTAEAARKTFEQFFGVTLRDLVTLYELPIWRHSAYGGNKWAAISLKVQDFVEAIRTEALARSEDLYCEIMTMRHNTGQVAEKLRRLRS
jgi:hypothetical protein